MLSPASYDFLIRVGRTFDVTLTWKHSDSSLVNLTGWDAKLQARSSVGAPDPPALEWTPSNGVLTLGGTAGTIRFYLSAAATALLVPATYRYDLELITPTAQKLQAIEGSVTIRAVITT